MQNVSLWMKIGQLLVQIWEKNDAFLGYHLKSSGLKYRSVKVDNTATRQYVWNGCGVYTGFMLKANPFLLRIIL